MARSFLSERDDSQPLACPILADAKVGLGRRARIEPADFLERADDGSVSKLSAAVLAPVHVG
jgi:hypothetical protein